MQYWGSWPQTGPLVLLSGPGEEGDHLWKVESKVEHSTCLTCMQVAETMLVLCEHSSERIKIFSSDVASLFAAKRDHILRSSVQVDAALVSAASAFDMALENN